MADFAERRIDYYQDINKLYPEEGQTVFKRTINSVVLFVCSFYIINLIHNVVSALIAKSMGFTPILQFYGVEGLPLETERWSKSMILLYFSSGPFAIFLIGILFWRYHITLRKSSSILRPISLWLAFHGLFHFFGYIVETGIGTGSYPSPVYFGLSVVTTWYLKSKFIVFPIALLGLITAVACAFFMSKNFMELSNSATRMNNHYGKKNFILYQVILPFLIGSGIIIALRTDKDMIETITVLSGCGIAASVILLSSARKIFNLKILKKDSLDYPLSITLLIGILLIIGIKVIFSDIQL